MVVGWDVVVFIVGGFVVVYRGSATGDFGGDGGVVGVYCDLGSGFEGGDYGRAWEYVGVCYFGPLCDLERTRSVLFLYCACRDLSVWFSMRSASVRLNGNNILPISPNFLSSKIRKRFRLATSLKPLTVLSPQSSMISAWVLRMQMESPTSSATERSSAVVETSAETQRLVFLSAMRWRR